ncbi:ankyrin repeat domain-containing protein [Guptibacillus hwajinpoensis]|uniref:ankyrin repeat domain-containing protein n=1 Tax=Guptibacillus hwajinpoensis TaxID=208199 RepID=UPI00273F7C85|nr:ankyrin repeat domain-containing protein [Pseudalkalibacillus hwajinpoensis]WLR59408.1 ankyrin repeat domain-containing protein [Pseudalkalibacillus hwajinpoensis]
MEAIINEDDLAFQSLIDKADLDATDSDGWNALHYAAEHSEKDKMFQALLDREMNPNAVDLYGTSALMISVQNGYVSKVSRLLKAGADPNMADIDGWTPLIYAAYMEPNNRNEMYNLLLEAGANPALQDEEGYTAIDYARDAGNEEDVKILSQ